MKSNDFCKVFQLRDGTEAVPYNITFGLSYGFEETKTVKTE